MDPIGDGIILITDPAGILDLAGVILIIILIDLIITIDTIYIIIVLLIKEEIGLLIYPLLTI
jgi:hypothetical protein